MSLDAPHVTPEATTTAGGARPRLTIVVEHLDPELEAWQVLEYRCIASECEASGAAFMLSGLPNLSQAQERLGLSSRNLSDQSVESLFATTAEERRRVCLLDPKGEKDLAPDDAELFDVFLFGGILGDDPPRDRTGELRKLGFAGRRLGAEQMTTDTAARVTRTVIQTGKRLDEIPYVDRPEISLTGKDGSAQESVEMPFRYVNATDGRPVLPDGMVELLTSDADKGILDLL